MEQMPELSRASLESMTTSELTGLADSRGVDIPFELDRIFIIEELLETDADVSTPPQPDIQDSGLEETALLPKHYNITYIEVMIRDPLWAFVFWEIKAQDREQFEKTQEFTGFYLKVTPLPDSREESAFIVPVNPEDTARYLGLNSVLEGDPSRTGQSRFTVELCAGIKNGEIVLAASGPVKLPDLPELPAGKEKQREVQENPLVRLSGYGEFQILRRNERAPRQKKDAVSGGGHR